MTFILKSDNSVGLKKAVISIKNMTTTLDDSNLEEKIQSILDEKN